MRDVTGNPADLVLVGGRIETMTAATATAIAVRSGRIAAVGADADMTPLIAPRTRVVDLRGRMVLPGFQDAHVHPPVGGVTFQRCDLHGLDGATAYLDRIREYAALNPARPWILGGGWAMEAFPGGTPTREALDAVVADRPVFLTNRDGHGAWVNSKALEVVGIAASTPDPADGRIERDLDGAPSGTLHEGAMDLVERLAPATTPLELEQGILAAQAYLHSLGITAWQDAWVTPDVQAAYEALDARGVLTARVVGALWWDRERSLEQIDELVERRAHWPAGDGRRFRPTSVKIMQDGVLENFTGAMLEPYLDGHGGRTANRGIGFVPPAVLGPAVTRLDALGFQVHVHAIGDRAVHEALDAFEAARAANGATDNRHHIAHIQVIHPTDVPRFAALGVVANMQPYWACRSRQVTELTNPFLGAERATWQYPFRSLARAGATLAGGSDWSVSTPDPLAQIEVAVTRVEHPGRATEPFLPAECLDLPTALTAYTRGSAFVNHLDAESGTLEAGKAADLVVLDRDLLAPDAGRIGDARVRLTLVDGRPVFEDAALDG